MEERFAEWKWQTHINSEGKKSARVVCSACYHANGRRWTNFCPNCGKMMLKPKELYFDYLKRNGMME